MSQAASAPYQLQLFISGGGSRSARAIVNVRRLCEQYLRGRYHLDVIDISSDPTRARQEQLVAVPTLIKVLPRPAMRFIGDMSRTQSIVDGLDPPLPTDALAAAE